MDLGIALGGTGGLVDVMAAKVTAEFEGLADWDVSKVLVAEDDNFSLGDE